MSTKRDLQQKIYDNKQDGYVPVYADRVKFAEYMRLHIERAKTQGRFGTSLKAVKNAIMIKKLGLKSGMKVLDAGCGGGVLINQLSALYGIKGYGLDLSKLAVQRARQCGSKGITYKNGVLEKNPYKSGMFDAVTSFDVLEHTEYKEKAIKEIYRVLKPGGKMLLYIISRRDLFTWHWFLRAVSFGRLGRDTEGGHFKEMFADPGEIKKYAENAGFKNIKISYLHSFFTLILDEAIFSLQKKSAKNENAKGAKNTVTAQGKNVYNILRVILAVFEALELPWKIFGLSNGFFVLAEKQGKA